MSAEARRLIVNADDFGRSHAINRGIAEAYDRGIVTSTSLMVRWPAAAEAAAYARARPGLALGLHLDLGEWRYEDGWTAVYRVLGDDDEACLPAELERQLTAFTALTGKLPSHLDSHQHVHLSEPLRSIVSSAGRRLGVPVRGCTPGVRYSGAFYGQTGRGEAFPEGIALDSLIALIEALAPGVTELGCHPAIEPEASSGYGVERPLELAVLCDPRVRAAVRQAGVELVSFAGLADPISLGGANQAQT